MCLTEAEHPAQQSRGGWALVVGVEGYAQVVRRLGVVRVGASLAVLYEPPSQAGDDRLEPDLCGRGFGDRVPRSERPLPAPAARRCAHPRPLQAPRTRP